MPSQRPSLYERVTSFLRCTVDLKTLRHATGCLLPSCGQSAELGHSHRCHRTPLAQRVTISLSSSFQTVGWLASHSDDLFKQSVRSITSCTHLIQNINVCCRCHFSCQLMHQEKMTFIADRSNFFTMVTLNALVKQSAGSGKDGNNNNNNNTNVSFN